MFTAKVVEKYATAKRQRQITLHARCSELLITSCQKTASNQNGTAL